MAVSQQEVDELRREGQALGLDGITNVLETTAERIGFMVAEARAMEMDETEMLDRIELVARAAQTDQQDLRAARDTLKALNYTPALIKLLTALARKAKPKPPSWIERKRRRPGLPRNSRFI